MRDSHFPASKKTIMVVDDNHDIVEILRTMLEENGFNVRCAYSGEELFVALEEQKPDLILLDIMMPNMDGYEVLTRLKWKTATASIPVILLTAKVYHKDVEKGYRLGTEYYIKKPFTITEVITNINRLLSKNQRTLKTESISSIRPGFL
ncbi:MAG: response regulator [Candidatus Binatia bacterium]